MFTTKTLKYLFILCLLVSCKSQNKEDKVLITAPKKYSERFAKALDKRNVKYIQLPVIETEILKNNYQMSNLMDSLKYFNWVAFSSRKAIESFFIYADKKNVLINNCKLKFFAIGKDAELLSKKYNCKNIIVPKEPSPQGIVNYLKTQPNIKNEKIVVIAPTVKDITEPDVVPNFINSLSKIMKVKRINGYCTSVNKNIDTQNWTNIIKDSISIIAFTSAGEAEAIKLMFGLNLLNSKEIGCFGPYTQRNAEMLGFKVNFIASDFSSFDGFADAINNVVTR